MKSIQLHSTLFPSQRSHPSHIKQLETPKSLSPCYNETMRLTPSPTKRLRFSTTRANAMQNSSVHDLVLTLASARAKSTGEVVAFVGVSAGLFVMFWVANFIVPDFITKNMESNKVTEISKSGDDDDDEEEEEDDDD